MLYDHCEKFSITSALIFGLVSCHDPCRGLMKQSACHFFLEWLTHRHRKNNLLGVSVSCFCHRRFPPSFRQKISSQNRFIVFLKQASSTHKTNTRINQPNPTNNQPSTTSFSRSCRHPFTRTILPQIFTSADRRMAVWINQQDRERWQRWRFGGGLGTSEMKSMVVF